MALTPEEEGTESERELLGSLAQLQRSVIRWLGGVILVAVSGVILIAALDSSLLDYFGPVDVIEPDAAESGGASTLLTRGSQTDQAVAILGNIASAGIGGLVGWATRDFTLRYRGVRVDSPPLHHDKDDT